MEFNIKGIVKEDGLPNTFVVEIKWMHGDADGYTTTLSKPFKKGADEVGIRRVRFSYGGFVG